LFGGVWIRKYLLCTVLTCPSRIRKGDVRKTMKEDEKDNRRRRRWKKTKRKANFTERKGENRGLEGDGIQKQEN
jgi:hypothetical protein